MHSCMLAMDELLLELFCMQEAVLEATVEASGMVRLCCSQSLDGYAYGYGKGDCCHRAKDCAKTKYKDYNRC